MTTRSRSCSALLGLALIAGCTSHADAPAYEDGRTGPDPVVAKPHPETETKTKVEVGGALTHGPRTPLTRKPFAAALGDLTGDAQPDLLTLCHGHESPALVLVRGAPDGSFDESEPVPVRATGLSLGDFDRDGDLDALLLDARSRPSYRVARNDGAGTFEIGQRERLRGRFGGELRSAAIADLDGDDTLDAVVPLWDTLALLYGDGDGNGGFRPGRSLAIGRDPFDVALGDLDGDGQLDLAATSKAGPAKDDDGYESAGASVWIYRGRAGAFAEPSRVEVSGAREVEIADLDLDGRPEVIVSGDAALRVIRDPLGEATTTAHALATDGPLLIADALAPAGPELLTSSYIQARVHLLAGYPEPARISVEAGDYVVGLYHASVGGDRRPDIVVLNAGPPGGVLDPPSSSVEVLFVEADGRRCEICEPG